MPKWHVYNFREFKAGPDSINPYLDEKHCTTPIPNEDICFACEEVDVRTFPGSGEARSYLLGYVEGIFNCSTCAICRIVTKGIEFDTGNRTR